MTALPIRLFDTTLRDGIQGLELSTKKRWAMFELIAQFNFNNIEIGTVHNSIIDFHLVERKLKALSPGKAYMICWPNLKSVKACAPLSKYGVGLHLFYPVGTHDILQNAPPDPGAKLSAIQQSVAAAKDIAKKVQWSAFDATGAEFAFLAESINVAINAGADVIGVPDSGGRADPQIYGALLERLYQNVPQLKDREVSIHCHDKRGFAVANAISALDKGALQIECAINGLGINGGNTNTLFFLQEAMKNSKYAHRVSEYDLQNIKALSNNINHLLSEDDLVNVQK